MFNEISCVLHYDNTYACNITFSLQYQPVTEHTRDVQSPEPRENGQLIPDTTQTSFMNNFRPKKSPLRIGKKIYEFYNAPVTKFWAHTVSLTRNHAQSSVFIRSL